MLVLVVESDALVRMVTLDLLEDAGFQTMGLAKVADVAAALQSGVGVHVLVVGRSIERKDDGVELAHLLKREWPELRVIVTSGMGADIEHALPAGTRLLRKPFEFGDLLDLIEGERTQDPPMPISAPVLPIGVPVSASIDAVAAPTSEPDKT